jgi:YidC/Oxa1 family membrane protein insertase
VKEKDGLSEQARVALAIALTVFVLVIWAWLGPKPQVPPQPAKPVAGAPASVAAPNATAEPSAAPAAAAADVAEKTMVIESDLYRVVLSNRGGVVRSWQLKKYYDEATPPHVLDVVHTEESKATAGWPLALDLGNAQLSAAANSGLYQMTPGTSAASPAEVKLTAPVEVEFHWSDGHLEVTKKLKFDNSYITQVETAVLSNRQPLRPSVAWLGGFGDVAAYRAALVTTVFGSQNGKLTLPATKNLGDPNQHSQFASVPGSFDAVGVQDLYFAAAFLPKPETAAPNLALTARQVQPGDKGDVWPEMAAGSTSADSAAMRLYVGPKDLDTLKAIRPPLNDLVQFGWFGFIAEPMFYFLRWVHNYLPNWGWCIVLVTILINTVLYPLKIKQWRGMQKMQKVAPEVRSIQDRYKKYSMRDPRKAEMNKEVMAVYSREGINPLGSCLPMLVQLPLWWALNSMIRNAIELRQAPWFGWIHDLSAKDPYYVLPIVMSILMYVVQKMTPTAVTDPSQQRMMNMMPIMMSAMFIIYPFSSGLVLYILVSNIVAVAQQYHLNHTSPVKTVPKGKMKHA